MATAIFMMGPDSADLLVYRYTTITTLIAQLTATEDCRPDVTAVESTLNWMPATLHWKLATRESHRVRVRDPHSVSYQGFVNRRYQRSPSDAAKSANPASEWMPVLVMMFCL